jgi:hypothetical protein
MFKFPISWKERKMRSRQEKKGCGCAKPAHPQRKQESKEASGRGLRNQDFGVAAAPLAAAATGL